MRTLGNMILLVLGKELLMRGWHVKLKYTVLFILFTSFVARGVLRQTADPNLMGAKSLAEVIERWDKASPSERVSIEDALFEDISGAIPVLRDKVVTGTRKQKMFACAMLVQMRDTGSVETLVKAMDDPDDMVKTRAIVSLTRLKAKQAVTKIRQQVAKAKNRTTLKAALAGLGMLGNAQDIPALRAHLSDPAESVRINAAVALALLGNHEGQEILLAGTQSTKPIVRKEATYSLGFVNTVESRNRLQEILDDPGGKWKTYAQIALAQQDLANKPPGQKISALKTLASDKNRQVAEWAVERIGELDTPQGRAALKDVGQLKGKAGRKAKRLLKIEEGDNVKH